MTYYDTQKGTNPAGMTSNIPVGGRAFLTTTILGANASVNTGWIPTTGYGSLLYVIRSDQASANAGVVVEYSDDGTSPISAGGGLTYSGPEVGMQIQRTLVPKANFTRITYTNGAIAQTTFRLEVKLSPTLIQPTETSLNAGLTGSELAMVVADVQFAKGLAGFEQITSTNGALNVNNPSIGAVTDTMVTDSTASGSVIALLKGILAETIPPATTSTVTSVTTLATTTTILAANPLRKGAVFNSVTGTILIKLGAGASATSYTSRLVTNGYYEMPPCGYTGIVTAIGAGTLIVTELT